MAGGLLDFSFSCLLPRLFLPSRGTGGMVQGVFAGNIGRALDIVESR